MPVPPSDVPGQRVPAVCVVVATYNRADVLPNLIAALKAQDHTDFEVVVVDDGSPTPVYDALVDLVRGDSRFRTLQLHSNSGPALARNVGWRSTSCPWIAFTDDDCEPTETWLSELIAATGTDADIVQGRTEPVASDWQHRGWFDRSQTIRTWSGRFETCNLLVRRELLQRLEGFDPAFPPMGEDTDFGLRALRLNARTTFHARALVHHHVWRTGYRGFLRHRRRHAEVVQLFRGNPEARDLLFWRVFVVRKHLFFWALVPTGVLAVVSGMPWIPLVLAAGWCAWNTLQTRRLPFSPLSRFARSVLLLFGYAYETWCFAVASLRYRTLVL